MKSNVITGNKINTILLSGPAHPENHSPEGVGSKPETPNNYSRSLLCYYHHLAQLYTLKTGIAVPRSHLMFPVPPIIRRCAV
jgi:hypothetical protein